MKKERGLYRRKRSPYWWICYSDKHGNTVRESTGVKEKDLARDILNKRRTEVAEDRFMKKERKPKLTMEQLCQLYWDRKGYALRFKGLDSIINQFKNYFRKTSVAALKQYDIEQYLVDNLKGKSDYTHNHHINMLKVMFNWAIGQELASVNPAAKVRSIRTVNRMRWLTLEEIEKLLAACNSNIRPIVEFALNTGMRKGEIFNLKWVDMDFNNGLIWDRTSHKGRDHHIPMNETARKLLESSPRKSMYVFKSRIGRCDKYTDIKKAFRAAVKKAGLRTSGSTT